MMELLMVLAFIGVIMAAALPIMTRVMRDARVGKAAMAVHDIVRLGVMRAKGRGSAVVVRWDGGVAAPTTDTAHVVIREAVLGTGGANDTLPVASCFTPNWANGSADSRQVASFDERRRATYELVSMSLIDPTNAPLAYAEFCFTPRGRAFVRTAPAGPFLPMTGVYRFLVTNTNTTKQWMVVIPPNGAIKVVSEI